MFIPLEVILGLSQVDRLLCRTSNHLVVDRLQDLVVHHQVHRGQEPAFPMVFDGKTLSRGDYSGGGGDGRGLRARGEQLGDQSLDIDLAVILLGGDVVCALLVLTQHLDSELFDEISEDHFVLAVLAIPIIMPVVLAVTVAMTVVVVVVMVMVVMSTVGGSNRY